MSTDFKVTPEQTAASLLSGIVGDLQLLLQQQLMLMRQELGIEVRRCVTAGGIICLGAGTLLLGGIALTMTLSHLLYWMVCPVGMDPGRIPLWACYGIIAVLVSLIGAGISNRGLARLRSITSYNLTVRKVLEEQVE